MVLLAKWDLYRPKLIENLGTKFFDPGTPLFGAILTEKLVFFKQKSEKHLLMSKSNSKCLFGYGFSSRNRFLALSMSYGVVFRVKSGKIKFRNFEKHVYFT